MLTAYLLSSGSCAGSKNGKAEFSLQFFSPEEGVAYPLVRLLFEPLHLMLVIIIYVGIQGYQVILL